MNAPHSPSPLAAVPMAPADPILGVTEAFVADKFQAAWQSRVTSFMPWLLSMHCLGSCSAVAGIRKAAWERLFLERYLDESIEAGLREATGTAIKRSAIVEIGNLADPRTECRSERGRRDHDQRPAGEGVRGLRQAQERRREFRSFNSFCRGSPYPSATSARVSSLAESQLEQPPR